MRCSTYQYVIVIFPNSSTLTLGSSGTVRVLYNKPYHTEIATMASNIRKPPAAIQPIIQPSRTSSLGGSVLIGWRGVSMVKSVPGPRASSNRCFSAVSAVWSTSWFIGVVWPAVGFRTHAVMWRSFWTFWKSVYDTSVALWRNYIFDVMFHKNLLQYMYHSHATV